MEDHRDQESQGSTLLPLPEVRRASIRTLNIYEVSEDELEKLTQRTADSICLSLAIFLLTVFASFLSVLLASSIASDRTFIVFVVITVAAAVAGFVLLCVWFKVWLKARGSSSALVKRIRNRLPPEGIQESNVTVENGDSERSMG